MKFKSGKSIYAVLNNILNILPPFGSALKLRGLLASCWFEHAGKNLKISARVNVYEPKNLSVGDSVYIGYNSYIGGGKVFLDDEVVVGPFCSIVAGNHTIDNHSYRFGKYDYGTITIGRGTWLGANVVVTSNVKIGKGCLIAAGSVVTSNVDDFSIVGGVPAKFIKKSI